MKTNELIMFNDHYGLTKAVLELRKTMTRMIIPLTDTDKKYLDTAFDWDIRERVIIDRYAKYKVGEVVAVAQSYKSVFEESLSYAIPRWHWLDDHIDDKGFENKMFVKASEMPHQIQITGVKVERLQDISEEDYLLDDLCGKGTWLSDPYVFAYSFKLLK